MGVCMEGRCSGVAAFWWDCKMGIGIWIGLGCMICFLVGVEMARVASILDTWLMSQ